MLYASANTAEGPKRATDWYVPKTATDLAKFIIPNIVR
jgi:hypothetical protein